MRKSRTLEVPLEPEELGALFRLAERERRDQASQAAWIVRRELERRGLLPTEPRALESASGGGKPGGRQ